MDKLREEFSELVENIGGNVQDRDIDYHTDEFEDIHVDYLWLMFKREIEAAKASQWISVEEDEPELGEEVAVAWAGCDDLSTDYLEINSDYGTHYWANYHAEPPTHWKRLLPLPEGPTK